jgi:hypothetical protein
MNAYLNAAAASEHQQQLLVDAAAHRRNRGDRPVKAIRRRTRKSHPTFPPAPRFAA